MKIGNLFELAENQLIKERREGTIPCYSIDDVIEYAIKIRLWLDNNHRKVKQIIKLTPKEIKKKNRQYRMKNYYAKLNK